MRNWESSPTLTNCRFLSNAAVRLSGTAANFNGGGVANYTSSPTVTGCVFSGNSARSGGGVHYDHASNGTVSDCLFSDNLAAYHGGGITTSDGMEYTSPSDTTSYTSNPVISNCVFSGNRAEGTTAAGGAALFTYHSSPTVRNCIFVGNTISATVTVGGAIRNYYNSQPLLTGCTFSENHAQSGGGMANYNSSPTIRNCIFWGDSSEIANSGNSTPTLVCNCISTDPDFANSETGQWTANAAFDADTHTTVCTKTGAGWTTDALVGKYLNPDTTQYRFFKVIANTQDTLTIQGNVNAFVTANDSYEIADYHLQGSSTCINAGDPNGDYSGQTDLDGNDRVIGSIVDMGCYESAYGRVHNLTQETFYPSIQDAIDAANDDDVIELAPFTYYELISFAGKNITLRSTDPQDTATVDTTIIDGDGDGPVVSFDGSETPDCTLDGLTITNGYSAQRCTVSSAPFATYATISRCVIRDNTGYGGIGWVYGTIDHCIIRDNDAYWTDGGGLLCCSGTISNCTITGNTAGWYGGGLYSCQGTIRNCIVTGNTADRGGGLAYCANIENCVIANNTANGTTGCGGGLLDCQDDIRGCTIVGNSASMSGGGLASVTQSSITDCIIRGNTAGSIYWPIAHQTLVRVRQCHLSRLQRHPERAG